ncbi:hypothetical protein GCM10027447_34920 [Glycomyces halotolerans]
MVITGYDQNSPALSWAPDHPDTLTAHANLANWSEETGDPTAAVTGYEAVLADFLRGARPRPPPDPYDPLQPRLLARPGR